MNGSSTQVLALCDINAAQLRPNLSQREQHNMLQDFNSPTGKIQVLICSYVVICAGLNLQKQCGTSIEFLPLVNESICTQELERVRRRGQLSPWVRHVTLLAEDTLNTKQGSEAILKNLPILLTQLNMEVWGKDDGEGNFYRLGDLVLHDGELCPVEDPKIKGLKLKPLDPVEVIVQIQIQLLGRKTDITGKTLRQQAKADLCAKKSKVTPKVDAAKGQAANQQTTGKEAGGKGAAGNAPASTELEFLKEPLWT